MKGWHLWSIVTLLLVAGAGFWLGKNKPSLLSSVPGVNAVL